MRAVSYRPGRRTRCVGIFVFNIENPNMFAGKSTLYIGDVWVLHPQKSPLPALFFQVVATPGLWDPANVLADLGSSRDSKTFELLTLAGSPKTFRVVKWVLPHAPGTSAGPIQRSAC